MYAATQKYVPPVQGRQSEISATRTRVDPAKVGRYIDLEDFVDGQLDETWTDTFFIPGDSYGMTACPCLLLSIVSRSMPTMEQQVDIPPKPWPSSRRRWGPATTLSSTHCDGRRS